MTEIPSPAWLPDWRKQSLYPDPETKSRKQWAWEFLRRNERYQVEWTRQDEADYSVRYSPKEYECYPKWASMVLLGGRWGLACNAPEPSIDVPEVLLFQQDYLVGAMTYEDVERYGRIPFVPNDWPIVNMTFNLNSPLHPQLEDAKRFLNETKARFMQEGKIGSPGKLRRSPSVDLLQHYLRCFDAKAKGASYSEIAEVVFPSLNNEYPDQPGSQRVKDHLSAAKELVESKYRYLANEVIKK